MGKRHNRKRTRSRARVHHRGENDTVDNNKCAGGKNTPKTIFHARSDSLDTTITTSTTTASTFSSSSTSTSASTSTPTTPDSYAAIQHRRYPRVATALTTGISERAADHHWHQAYLAWQDRLRIAQEQEWEVEMQQLRMFGGMPGDEVALIEPMLKVVMDLFDGYTDYHDP